MKKLAVAIGLLLVVVLAGCNRSSPTVQSSVNPSQTAAISATRVEEIYSLNDLNHAKPYRVVREGRIRNEDITRTAGSWYITAPTANSYTEYAHTVIRAALDLYQFYRRDSTSVLLLPAADINVFYAQASYAADGRGAAGMTGSAAAKPMYWRVWVLDDQPLSERELEIARLRQMKMADFRNPDRLSISSSMYDEEALRTFISQTLNIPYAETAQRQLDRKDYHLEDIPASHPILERFPNPPVSESLIRSLSGLKTEFTAEEKDGMRQSAANLPSELQTHFADLFEEVYQTTLDPGWNVYSTWRPYTQSGGYQEILQFCRNNGQSIWSLLFSELQGERSDLVAGLIVDTTLPEYLCYLKLSSAGALNPTAADNLTDTAQSVFEIGQYVKVLLSLETLTNPPYTESWIPTPTPASLPVSGLNFETALRQVEGYSTWVQLESLAARRTITFQRDDPIFIDFMNLLHYSLVAQGGSNLSKTVKGDGGDTAVIANPSGSDYFLNFNMKDGTRLSYYCSAGGIWFEDQDTIYQRVFSPELRTLLETIFDNGPVVDLASGIIIHPAPGTRLESGAILRSVALRFAPLDQDYMDPTPGGRIYRTGESVWLVSGQLESDLATDKYMIIFARGYDIMGQEVAHVLDAGPIQGVISIFLPAGGFSGFRLHLNPAPGVVRIDLYPSHDLYDITPP